MYFKPRRGQRTRSGTTKQGVIQVKAAVITLGCKVNQYESEAIAAQLAENGYEIVDSDSEAEIYVVNSCTVTAESDRKTRQTVRRIKRLHPQSAVVLTGCMPQAFPESAEALTQADIVTGNKLNNHISKFIKSYFESGRVVRVEPHEKDEPFCACTVSRFRERTRATVKIEDGCNRFCSYCIIPYARGRVRSKPLEVIAEEVGTLARAGYGEIVLVGINLSAYGSDIGLSIVDAVRAAAEPKAVKRVRLGSLEPDHITDSVIRELAKEPKFCPQFHISLQSGCDNTLKRMNRHYTADEYYSLCRRLRASFKDTTLTTDVMVGFPGETQEDFEASLAFVKKVGFEKIHVFPYSRRDGTPAARMTEQLPNAVKEKRAAEMAQAAAEIRRSFLLEQVGKTLEVLPEEHYGNGTAHGYTANYTPVCITGGKYSFGEITAVRITGVDDDRCVGIVD